jgi:hypothetical protein
MTHGEQTHVRSYAGVQKPISRAQLDALALVERGDVYYKPRWGRVFGCRNDTFEVLERNALVEVLDEPQNPTHRPAEHRHAVVLTQAGRGALEARS